MLKQQYVLNEKNSFCGVGLQSTFGINTVLNLRIIQLDNRWVVSLVNAYSKKI